MKKPKERHLYSNQRGSSVVLVTDVDRGSDPMVYAVVVKGRGQYVELFTSEFHEQYPRAVDRIDVVWEEQGPWTP